VGREFLVVVDEAEHSFVNEPVSPDKRATGLARQDVKEPASSDDIRSRSDDSYSPRRHWWAAWNTYSARIVGSR
jgi:hypothetical protein